MQHNEADDIPSVMRMENHQQSAYEMGFNLLLRRQGSFKSVSNTLKLIRHPVDQADGWRSTSCSGIVEDATRGNVGRRQSSVALNG